MAAPAAAAGAGLLGLREGDGARLGCSAALPGLAAPAAGGAGLRVSNATALIPGLDGTVVPGVAAPAAAAGTTGPGAAEPDAAAPAAGGASLRLGGELQL